ncbi:MAG: hypothetical protein A2014_05495 [Spirochaetes bacterium GWF1_49_6]|nr:MAG: hypothetical protein A2014_05495 [Spirochaetes bacterium GWF1_49_6]
MILEKNGGVTADIKVVPRSKRAAVEVDGENITLRITAPPVDGKANDAVTAGLSSLLGVPKRDISIVRGQTSRNKTVEIRGVGKVELISRLGKAGR